MIKPFPFRVLRCVGYPIITIPQYMLSSQGSCAEGFQNYTDWQLSGGSAANNTTAGQFSQGSQSVKFTAASTEQRCYKYPFGPVDITNLERVYLDIYPHDAWKNIYIRMYTNHSHTPYTDVAITLFCNSTIGRLSKGYSCRRLMTPVGGMSFSDPLVEIRPTIGADGVQSWSLDNLVLNAVGFGAGVILRFDDSYESAYTLAYPILKEHHMVASIACETGIVGTGGRLTWLQLAELDRARWCIANHADTNVGLAGQDLATQTTRVQTAITALESHGLTKGSHILIYPAASFDSTSYVMMTNLSIPIGVDVGDAPATITYLPFSDLRNVHSKTCNSGYLPAAAQTYLDNAITDKAVAIFHFHDIGGAGEWTVAQLQAFVDYIVVKCKAGLLYSLSWSDFYNLHNGSVKVPRVG